MSTENKLIKFNKGYNFNGLVYMSAESLNIVIENHNDYIEMEQCDSIIIIPKNKIKTLVSELMKLDV